MNPFELFGFLFQMSLALNSTVIIVSKSCSFPLSAVSLYEAVEALDDKDKPTGEVIPLVVLTSGKEIELTPEQNQEFMPRWNYKVSIDDKLRACVAAMDAQLFKDLPALDMVQPAQS
jgi:hypothetical protein